jgi:NAD(P)-dependent dehydrogenase (short-subunit alcohol dehydrogenase family)
MDFKDKCIVITGAGSGIGKKTARRFLEQGARVMISDNNQDVLKAAEMELKAIGDVASFAVDVRDYQAMTDMARCAIETFGHVDVWINNAGTSFGLKNFVDTTSDDWKFDIDINFVGVLNGCKAILPHFIERKAGKIVNTVSDAGRVGEPRLSIYSGAKAGVMGFSKALAKEVGKYNILINCVSLGTTKTETIQLFLDASGKEVEEKMSKAYALRRLGDMDDAANALMLMSSDYVTWITGQTLSSSGGFSFVG